MSRPDPIQYAERLYAAIREANFSPISFLAFGNAVKEGIALRNMPRTAAEPFMRVVGEMLDLEEDSTEQGIIDAAAIADGTGSELGTVHSSDRTSSVQPPRTSSGDARSSDVAVASMTTPTSVSAPPATQTDE